jgi:hypothetical protein
LISPDKQWMSDARATLMTQVKNSLPAQPMPMPAKAKTAVSMFVRQTVSSVRGPALAVSSSSPLFWADHYLVFQPRSVRSRAICCIRLKSRQNKHGSRWQKQNRQSKTQNRIR